MTGPKLHKAIFHEGDPLEQMHLIRECMHFIEEQCLTAFYRHFYANDDEVIFVMTDRNAALIMKLALG